MVKHKVKGGGLDFTFFLLLMVDILGELDKTRLGNYVNKEEMMLNKEQKYNVKDTAMKVRDKP